MGTVHYFPAEAVIPRGHKFRPDFSEWFRMRGRGDGREGEGVAEENGKEG